MLMWVWLSFKCIVY